MPIRRSAFLLPALLPLAFGAGGPQPATAQDSLLLTRQEARTLALRSGPGVLAARARGEAARGAALTDRIYPFNPRVELKGVEAVDPGGYGDYEAVFSQELEWAGQWWVRRTAAGEQMEALSLEEGDAMRTLLLEVDLAFFRLFAAEEGFGVAEEGAELAGALREAVGIQLQAGRVSALEMNLTIIEAGRSQARALAAGTELAMAQQGLRDLLGLSAGTLLSARDESPGTPVVGPDISDPDALVDRALTRRPDLLAAQIREKEAGTRRRLASKEAIPNLDLGAVADRGGSDADATLGLRIAFPLPLWNRNQGKREEARALENLRQVERNDLELRIQGEVLAALEGYRAATEELELFTATIWVCRSRVVGRSKRPAW
ncbi:TolC family protein [Gemmatimonadota bacterium]